MDNPAAILFLGKRSPYGLSVARCLLESGPNLRRVLVPTKEAWERLARLNGSMRTPQPSSMISRAVRAARRAFTHGAPAAPPGGEPVIAWEPDAGITAKALLDDCERRGIPWQAVDRIRSRALRREIAALRPDLLLSASCPFIFDEDLLDLPRLGSINFHPSLLPRCRGCHPIYWTLASGEASGGVTAHFMSREVDAGDIVAQIELPLSDRDDYASLYRRCMKASPELVARVVRFVRSGAVSGVRQDGARATFFNEDTEEDHRIDWSRADAARIAARVRAGQAFTTWRGERLGILRARPHPDGGAPAQPGLVKGFDGSSLLVACAGSTVALESLAWRSMRYEPQDLCAAIGIGKGTTLENSMDVETIP